MRGGNKFKIAAAPIWAESPSEGDVVALITEAVKQKSNEDNNLLTCYLCRRFLRSLEDKNEDYNLLVYRLDWADDLQLASVQDYILRNDQIIMFHRCGVIRDNVYIDKLAQTEISVYDNEPSSSYGSINKEKKVHCLIKDLHLSDVLIIEYSIVQEFFEDNTLDRGYCRFFHWLPRNNWNYKDYQFKFFNCRNKKVSIKNRYFRDSTGNIISEGRVIANGEIFCWGKLNFCPKYELDVFDPILEIVTLATWEEILKDVSAFYDLPMDDEDIECIDKILLKINNGAESLDDKIRKIIEYAQNHIIYIYDADVMHGHIPQSVKITLEKQSGDCKAKSLLLVGMLSRLGINAKFALVNYDAGFYPLLDQPSPFIFNHVIVKIYYDDKIYFVDTTWSDCFGRLENRAQPKFGFYLEVDGEPCLSKAPQSYDGLAVLEENITINITKGRGKIKSETVYRFSQADERRKLIRQSNQNLPVKMEAEYHCARMEYSKELDWSEHLSDVEYKIIQDNHETNEVRDLFTATLVKPYLLSGKSKIFKYYFAFNQNNLSESKNKDTIISNFVDGPRRASLTINCDKLYDYFNKVLRQNCEIENDYFYFSNKKKLSFKTVKVFTEFRSKGYKPIDRADLENIKKDCKKIEDSNYGVGVVYQVPGYFRGALIIMAYIFLSFLISYI